ncbi:MAG: TlpA family protein disulfide reductase [Acidobacteria bacterium]|nr:TlpA family protein disulfide reductase [Acidobacteriota bacterium]MBU4307137.1 TlpA family protein disulfide reductase [Acidobacteriota bacterium]MBU4405477.1 TlpA family protein disulfide reductase [Acidobacteriota bacterium]MCG2812659.1 TlpA family protein disulfide reductase [Candidatus Aminicenantes bacterium]
MKTIKLTILITTIILGLAVSYPVQAANSQPPDFETKDIAGKAVKLSDLKGKVVLLDFWATWCPPCRVEIPNLLGIFRQFKNKDFILISVSLDRDLQAARKFVKDKEMDWVHIINMEAGREIATLYQVEYIPSTFVIGRKGKIEARQLRGDELKNKIASLLK